MSHSRFRVPHTLVLLFGMCLLALGLAWILPQGQFERVVNEAGREVVVAGTYSPVANAERLRPWALFTAIPKGFAGAEEIIFFIFLIGGAFGVFRATGAADAGIAALLRRFGHQPQRLITATILLFALGSSTIGMAEEYIPFVPVLLALAIGLGYDAVTAVGMLCIGYSVGYGAAALNPFTVVIAQGVAGLAPTSGIGFRLLIFPVFLVVGVHHVLRYARRVKAAPETSLTAGLPVPEALAPSPELRFTRTHWAIIAAIVATLAFLVWGIKQYEWYVDVMGATFLGLTVVMAILARLGVDETARQFCTGAAELTTTALLVGFARAITVILEEGKIIDTVVQAVAQPLAAAGATVAAIGMFLVQSLFNFFIPSGSGQAYVTMPLMAPIGDLVGVSRQTAVLAYQFGDGFTNILVPTNAVLVGILAMAGVPYDRWFKFVIPFMIKIWVVGSVMMAVAVWVGYS